MACGMPLPSEPGKTARATNTEIRNPAGVTTSATQGLNQNAVEQAFGIGGRVAKTILTRPTVSAPPQNTRRMRQWRLVKRRKR